MLEKLLVETMHRDRRLLPAAAEACISQAFIQADKKLLTPQGGFMGLGERGVGGSKCGASAAVLLVYR